jgi:hypothetical protein
MGHLDPIVVWIAGVPVRHGERDDSKACLCGRPHYLECPHWPGGGVAGLRLTGRGDDDEAPTPTERQEP